MIGFSQIMAYFFEENFFILYNLIVSNFESKASSGSNR